MRSDHGACQGGTKKLEEAIRFIRHFLFNGNTKVVSRSLLSAMLPRLVGWEDLSNSPFPLAEEGWRYVLDGGV